MNASGPLRVALGLAITASAMNAQAMSSPNYFVPSTEFASGATCQSISYRANLAVGAGVVLARSFSTAYTMVGGYAATLDVSPAGRPWITHVDPGIVMPKSQATLSIHGIGLNLGSSPAVKVGTQAAAIQTRTPTVITAKLPSPATPGYPVVSLSTSAGTTSVTKSVGVLPLVYTESAPGPDVAFEIVFKGSQNDSVIWALGALPGPTIPLPPLLHGLELNPALLLILPGFPITDASGEFRMPIAPVPYSGPIYLQAVFSSSNAGYAPGSFSNVIKL